MTAFLTEDLMKGTDWRALERAVARTMSHCGWTNVQVIGRQGDRGGDVIGIRYENSNPRVYVVQVKAITNPNYVGPKAVQEAIDAMAFYGGDVAVVATNGDFTRSSVVRQQELVAQGFDVRLWNGRFLTELLSKWPSEHYQRNQLRPYQQQVVDKTIEYFRAGRSRIQFVVATGLGKSTIAAEIVDVLSRNGLNRALVLCHAQPLARQLEQSFWNQLCKEIPTRVFMSGEPPKPYPGVNFGLYQTLVGYLGYVEPDDFDIVVVDEAHHAMSLGFRQCIEFLRPKLLVGMTATPWRGDGQSIDRLFGPPIASISLVDGMKMGFLAEVEYRIFTDSIDWEKLIRETGGKFTIRDLNKRLFVPQRDQAIIDEILAACEKIAAPRIIVFCPSKEHSRRFAELLTYSGIPAKALSVLDPASRFQALTEFATGKLGAVTAVDVLNEGIDVPDVNLLVFLRATHSRRIFVQQLGRGLRLTPHKQKVQVLDFVSDIRRIAEVMTMDAEARRPIGNQTVWFKDGIVSFKDEGIRPFVQEWLKDITDLSGAGDMQTLRFPEGL